MAVPDRRVAPEHRVAHRVVLGAGRFRVGIGMPDQPRLVTDGIEHRHIVGRFFGGAVNVAVCIDRGMALVGRDRVMHVGGGRAPIPRLTTMLRSRPVGRDGSDDGNSPLAIRSVQSAKSDKPFSGPSRMRIDSHVGHGLARLKAARPHVGGICEISEFLHARRANVLAAERMAGLARVFDRIDPSALGLQEGRNSVACFAGARKLVRRRDMEHRIPVHPRIIFRGRRLRRRKYRGQIEVLAQRAIHSRGVDEFVAAHPDLVVRLRQIGNEVAPASSVTTILANLVGRSVVSAMTQTPASGPCALATTPPMSAAPIDICAAGEIASVGDGAVSARAAIEVDAISPARTAADARLPRFL